MCMCKILVNGKLCKYFSIVSLLERDIYHLRAFRMAKRTDTSFFDPFVDQSLKFYIIFFDSVFFLYKCYIFIRLLHVSLPNTLSIIEATTIECALFLHEWSKYCKLTRVFRAEPVYSILFIVFAFAREDTSMILGHYQQSTYNYQKHCNMTNSTQNR